MANTYTWSITKLDCLPTSANQTNVVNTVYWILTGTDGTHTSSLSGQTILNYVAGAPFTAYASLTQAQVIQWVQAYIGSTVSDMEKTLDAQIASLVSPKIITPALPWGA